MYLSTTGTMARGVRQEIRRGLWAAGFSGQHQRMLNRFLGGRHDSRRWVRRGKPLVDAFLLEVGKLAFLEWGAQGKPPLDVNFSGEKFLRGILKKSTQALRAHREAREEELSRTTGGSAVSSSQVSSTEPRPSTSRPVGDKVVPKMELDPDVTVVPKTEPEVDPDVEILPAPGASSPIVISSDSEEILG